MRKVQLQSKASTLGFEELVLVRLSLRLLHPLLELLPAPFEGPVSLMVSPCQNAEQRLKAGLQLFEFCYPLVMFYNSTILIDFDFHGTAKFLSPPGPMFQGERVGGSQWLRIAPRRTLIMLARPSDTFEIRSQHTVNFKHTVQQIGLVNHLYGSRESHVVHLAV